MLNSKVAAVSLGLWIGLNATDSITTFFSTRLGATELNPVYLMSGSWAITILTKWLVVGLIPLMLVWMNRPKWMFYFVPIAVFPVAFNIIQLIFW
ncbi:MAG: DUF5658 family protein [Dehalococcoidales bacterium]|nr:DUF5658 family protein [Dehalococcoidales bacterium]